MTLQHFTLEHLTLMCNFLPAPELCMQASEYSYYGPCFAAPRHLIT
jgi:hypothetical protein